MDESDKLTIISLVESFLNVLLLSSQVTQWAAVMTCRRPMKAIEYKTYLPASSPTYEGAWAGNRAISSHEHSKPRMPFCGLAATDLLAIAWFLRPTSTATQWVWLYGCRCRCRPITLEGQEWDEDSHCPAQKHTPRSQRSQQNCGQG